MKSIDSFSYKLGAADCFCEMVRAGVKKIALAHPCDSREERDGFLPEFRKLCEEYGVKLYCEDEGFLTDLFPAALNKDRFNVIFYQEDAVLQEYLALKEEKRKARETGAYTPEKRRECAWREGRVLSVSDEGIERLLAANRDRED